MIHQRYKDTYFVVMQPILRLNHYRYKYFSLPSNSRNGSRRLHLGCGDKYLPGFLNIDGNITRKVDMRLDLRNGLPFGDNSVDFIYTCGVLEHFYPNELEFILRECCRVLKMGCGIRIVVPNLRSAILAYMNGKAGWFGDWPRSFQSLGGKFANFILCDGQHRNAFDFNYFEEVLRTVGFHKVIEQGNGESMLHDEALLRELEIEPDPDLKYSLYIECLKSNPHGE